MPSTNNVLYLKYIVRDLSFTQSSKDEDQEFEDLSLNLGYSSPTIEKIDDSYIAIMPFKFDLKGGNAFSLSCELNIGFSLPEQKSEDQFKHIVNQDSEYFSKYINNAINKIISDTLSHTAFKVDEVFDTPEFCYKD